MAYRNKGAYITKVILRAIRNIGDDTDFESIMSLATNVVSFLNEGMITPAQFDIINDAFVSDVYVPDDDEPQEDVEAISTSGGDEPQGDVEDGITSDQN